MVKISDTKKFFDERHFKRWLRQPHPALEAYRECERSFLSAHVRPGSALLDVGCGTGKSLEPVISCLGRVCGIDFSQRMLDDAGALLGKNPKLELLRCDAASMPFADHMFDYVICMGNTYGNFEAPELCLSEMLRVAKPEGEVILSVYSPNALEAQLESYREIGLNIKKVDEGMVCTSEGLCSRRFTSRELEEAALAQCASAKVRELTPISYLAVLQKASGQPAKGL